MEKTNTTPLQQPEIRQAAEAPEAPVELTLLELVCAGGGADGMVTW